MGESFGFVPNGYNQIIVFNNEDDFRKIIAANPNMTAIMGADDYTRCKYPGVLIAGVKAEANSPSDSTGDRLSATQK